MEATKRDIDEAVYELIGDPLSSSTRSSRRNVIFLSVVCLIVSNTGIQPGKIHLPFFSLEGLDESHILFGLWGLILFAYLGFLVSAYSDFFRFQYRKDKYNLAIARFTYSNVSTPPDEDGYVAHMEQEFEDITNYKNFEFSIWTTKTIRWLRITIDFVFPTLFGALSLYSFTKFFALFYYHS